MIPAMGAQMMNGEGSAGGGTLAYADFVNGVYSVGGVLVTAADIVDQPGLIGVNGLGVDSDGAEIAIIGALRTALLALNWTVVIEFEALDSLYRTFLLGMRNTADTQSFHIERRDLGDGLAMLVQDIAVGFRENLDATGHGIGIHKTAITNIPSLLATSTDGNAAVVDAKTSPLTSLDLAAFGAYPGAGFTYADVNIRSLVIYSAVPSADLPALSA